MAWVIEGWTYSKSRGSYSLNVTYILKDDAVSGARKNGNFVHIPVGGDPQDTIDSAIDAKVLSGKGLKK